MKSSFGPAREPRVFSKPLRAPFEEMPLESLLAIHTTFMRSPEDSVHAAFIADIIRSRNEAAR